MDFQECQTPCADFTPDVATLGIVVGLVDFLFLLSILCVLLILSRLGLIRATISVLFVPCCPVLLSLYLSYRTCNLNLINGDGDVEWLVMAT